MLSYIMEQKMRLIEQPEPTWVEETILSPPQSCDSVELQTLEITTLHCSNDKLIEERKLKGKLE